MKKLTNILMSFSLLLSFSSFAIDSDEVSTKVKNAFQNSFANASEVQWKKDNAINFVSFKLAGEAVSAVYNEDGELKSSSRKLSLARLPLKILLSLKEGYAGYTINEVATEVFSNDETNYFITAENEKFSVKIKSDAAGNLSAEKTKK